MQNKVRVVFDCAAQHHGRSLNQQLLQGPYLLHNLVGVLCRFRKEKVTLVADIEAMYHQVKVRPEDHKYLQFLWCPGENDGSVAEYCWQVLPFRCHIVSRLCCICAAQNRRR